VAGGTLSSVQLRDLCGVRSGDKGDQSDLTLFVDDEATYQFLRSELTASRVKAHFGSVADGDVVRYEAPNVWALKFVLGGALGGGGPLSLRSDNLGKTLGGALLRLRVDVPDDILARSRRAGRRAPISMEVQ
jgi:hypothetical protein